MPRKPVFLSFDYNNDVFRVQQIRNIGSIEGQTLLLPNDFEKIKLRGNSAVQKWIDDNMKYKQCVIVLIGSNTANRLWVNYEIEKSWQEKRPMFGVYIHNMNCPTTGYSSKGKNPFDILGPKVSSRIECHDPSTFSLDSLYQPGLTKGQIVYREIEKNIEDWIEGAIENRKLINYFGGY